MKLFRLYLMAFIAALIFLQASRHAIAEDIPYRILALERRQFSEETVLIYAISVDRFLDRLQIETLIRRVLKDGSPNTFSGIRMSIFYRLDKAFVTGGSRAGNFAMI